MNKTLEFRNHPLSNSLLAFYHTIAWEHHRAICGNWEASWHLCVQCLSSTSPMVYMFFSLSKSFLNFAVSFSYWTLHCCALLCTPSFLPKHICNESPYIYLLPPGLPHHPTIILVVMISTLGILQNDALVKTPIGLCRNPDYARKDCSVFVIYQSDGMFFSLSKNLLNFAVSFSHWTLHCCALLCTPSFLPKHICNESPYIYLLPPGLPHHPTIILVVMISTLGILQNDALVKTPIGFCRNLDYARKDWISLSPPNYSDLDMEKEVISWGQCLLAIYTQISAHKTQDQKHNWRQKADLDATRAFKCQWLPDNPVFNHEVTGTCRLIVL